MFSVRSMKSWGSSLVRYRHCPIVCGGMTRFAGVSSTVRRLGLLLFVTAFMGLGYPSAGLGFKTGVGCHGAFKMPGFSVHSDVFDAVQVLSRRRMSCNQALRIAAKARWLKGLKVIYGPQFGGGGWGGPFHVDRWHCYVLSRGSDFILGRCTSGAKRLRFYDHRSYWSAPDPGFSPPTRNP